MFPAEISTTVAPSKPSEPVSPGRERDLLSTICHDLRAPLASIVMGTGFLRRVLPPEEAAALRVVESMMRSADRMGQLIAAFHDLGRLQSRDLTLSFQSLDVEAVARVAFQQSVDAAQGVVATFEVGPGLAGLVVSCDRERLVQSLKLLASSALRVLPEGGTLALRADVSVGGGVRFVVEARHGGPGCRPIVAEPPKPELALAKGLIELHDGSLEQTGDAERLTFAFTLPHRSRVLAPTSADLPETR
jgi:nitrogen-specific signal transduction histidine kinase